MDLEEARNRSIEEEMGLEFSEATLVDRGLGNAPFGIARGAGKLVGGSCRVVTALSQRVKLCGQRIAGLQDRQARQDTQLHTLEIDNSALRDDLEAFNMQVEEGRQLNAFLCDQVSSLKQNLEAARSELEALQKQAESGSLTPSPPVEDSKTENDFLRLELERAWAQASEINYKNGVLSQRVSAFETQLACTQGQLKQARDPGVTWKSEPAPANEPTAPESTEDTAQVSENEPASKPGEGEAPQTPEESSTVPESSEDTTQVLEDEPVSETNEGETSPTPEESPTVAEPVFESDAGDTPQVFPETLPTADEIESAVFAASTDRIVFKKALRDLASENSTTRADGANALGYILHELSVRVLTFHLQDEPTAPVRAEIINGLAKLGKAQAAPAVELALSDSHATVRLAAVRGVYRLAGDAAADLLIRMFTDEDESVRRRAVVCLGWLESPESAPALIPLIGDVSVSVRQSAIEAVASLRNPATIPALIDQMDDPEESIRLLIVETLKTLSGKDMPKIFPKNRTAYLRLIARWRQWWQDQNAEVSDQKTA